MSHKEGQQPKKIGIEGVGKIEKHQVYSPTGQGSYKLISSVTAPSLEVIADADPQAQFAVQAHEEGRACGVKTRKGDTDLADEMPESKKQEELMITRRSQEKGGGASAAFMEDKEESTKPPVMTWKKDGAHYQEFL